MNRSTGRPAQSRPRFVLDQRLSKKQSSAGRSFEGLERRTMLCAGGEHVPAIHAAMEAAKTPVVHELHAAGTAARFFQPLDALPRTHTGQLSYLSLKVYSLFTIDTAALRRTPGDAPLAFTA